MKIMQIKCPSVRKCQGLPNKIIEKQFNDEIKSERSIKKNFYDQIDFENI